jgi:acyl dehydratase
LNVTNRFLDDLKPGERFVTAGITLTETQIIEFALQFDPQPFLLDADVAARSPYGEVFFGDTRACTLQKGRV